MVLTCVKCIYCYTWCIFIICMTKFYFIPTYLLGFPHWSQQIPPPLVTNNVKAYKGCGATCVQRSGQFSFLKYFILNGIWETVFPFESPSTRIYIYIMKTYYIYIYYIHVLCDNDSGLHYHEDTGDCHSTVGIPTDPPHDLVDVLRRAWRAWGTRWSLIPQRNTRKSHMGP